jgi:hypothetical protein
MLLSTPVRRSRVRGPSTPLACSAAAAVILGAAPALADDVGPTASAAEPLPLGWQVDPAPDRPKAPLRPWYGGEMLVAFAISDAAIVGSVASTANGDGRAGFGLGLIGVSGHFFAGPITHWAHGYASRGLASFGLNFAGTAAGSAVGMGIWAAAGPRSCEGEQCGGVFPGFFLGASIGLLAVNVIDASVLAYDDKPNSLLGSLSIAPIVAPHRGGVVVRGAF